MSGLHRLSTDIGGVVSHHLLAYAFPLSASSPSPSLLSWVQRKPETLFFLGRIHLAGIRLEFTFLLFDLGGAGLRITKIAGVAQAIFGWRVWTCEVVEWYLERLGWSVRKGRVWECSILSGWLSFRFSESLCVHDVLGIPKFFAANFSGVDAANSFLTEILKPPTHP